MNEPAPRLLVVDDSEDNRYTLGRRLRREGYRDILTAENGSQALEVLRSQPIDLVLLDIMMPQMNGYQVLEKMKVDAHLCNVPVIMVSAIEELESVVRCIELGAEDYLSKPFEPALLRARVGASLEKKRLRDQVRANLLRLQQEFDAARKLQFGMLPGPAPRWSHAQPVEISAFMEPAREVGGDLYDYFALGERSLCFMVGDVAGKGVAAAMFMARMRSLLRLAAELWNERTHQLPAPSEILHAVNRELCRNNDDRTFVTAFLGILDMKTGTLRYVNAGHPIPYRKDAAGSVIPLENRPQSPLGVSAASSYGDQSVEMKPGEALFLFSDGVSEAESGEGLFGEARVERALRDARTRRPEDLVQSLRAALARFAPFGERADDVVMLAVSWQPAGAAGP